MPYYFIIISDITGFSKVYVDSLLVDHIFYAAIH